MITLIFHAEAHLTGASQPNEINHSPTGHGVPTGNNTFPLAFGHSHPLLTFLQTPPSSHSHNSTLTHSHLTSRHSMPHSWVSPHPDFTTSSFSSATIRRRLNISFLCYLYFGVGPVFFCGITLRLSRSCSYVATATLPSTFGDAEICP
jgi:hypothetical protein